MTSRMNSLKGQSFFSGLSSAVFNLEFGIWKSNKLHYSCDFDKFNSDLLIHVLFQLSATCVVLLQPG